MIRPWYRSRLFWLGVAGALFLLGIWLGYARKSVDVSWGTRSAQYCLGWGGWGDVGFVINEHKNYSGLDGSPELGFYWNIDHLKADDKPQLIAPALRLDNDRLGIFIANWLIMLIYLILWIAGLIYWQRRKRRLSRGS